MILVRLRGLMKVAYAFIVRKLWSADGHCCCLFNDYSDSANENISDPEESISQPKPVYTRTVIDFL